jgi:hypothetical protein
MFLSVAKSKLKEAEFKEGLMGIIHFLEYFSTARRYADTVNIALSEK